MISVKHKTVFIHIPKCGGSSIEMMYLQSLNLSYKHRAPLLLRKNLHPELGPPRLAHLTYDEYIDYNYFSHDAFNEYFSFALVRNPYSRVISLYKYLGFNFVMSLSDFIRKVVAVELKKQGSLYWFLRPQTEFICSKQKSKIEVDLVCKLEDINDYVDVIKDKSNLKSDVRLPHFNKTKDFDNIRKFKLIVKNLFYLNFSFNPFFSSKKLFSEKDYRIINNLYKNDFSILDYKIVNE